METSDLRSASKTLEALFDEALSETFEPSGNITRRHHLEGHMDTMLEAVCLFRAGQYIESLIEAQTDPDAEETYGPATGSGEMRISEGMAFIGSNLKEGARYEVVRLQDSLVFTELLDSDSTHEGGDA